MVAVLNVLTQPDLSQEFGMITVLALLMYASGVVVEIVIEEVTFVVPLVLSQI